MSFLDEIAERLESNNVGTLERDIFIHFMPAEVKRGVVLIESLSGAMIDHELKGMNRTAVQAVVRNPDYSAGIAKAKEVITALTIERELLTKVTVNYMRARHQPVVYPRSDAGNTLEVSINFDANYVE